MKKNDSVKTLADRYTTEQLEYIIRRLHKQHELIRNPKSKYSVASAMTARLATGRMGLFVNGNIEISPRAHTNMCGERNNVREARNHGHEGTINGKPGLPLIVLDNFILGKDTTRKPSEQLGNKTPCCHMCLEEVYQFRSPREDIPTLIHQIPYFPPNTPDWMEKTLAAIHTDTIYDLVPPVLHIETDVREEHLLSKKADGIFSNKNKDQLFKQIQKNYKQLTGEELTVDNVPPLNGDITHFVRKARIDVGDMNTVEESSKMSCLLGIMRNIAAWKHFDESRGCVDPDIHHFDCAISATTDGKYYIGSSLGGKNISAQHNGIFMSLNSAKNEDHKHLVSHLFIMGDPISPEFNRLYPVIGEIYDINKRSTKSEGGGGHREPDMRIYSFAPNPPSIDVEPDTRERAERLGSEASPNIVVRYRLSELVKNGSTFLTAVEQRVGQRTGASLAQS